MESLGIELRDGLLGSAIEGTGGVRYHLRELLGEGGQGWVYKANYDDPDGFWVVVKVLRPDGLTPDTLKRFEREAEVLRMLGSVPAPNPNIVRFYDYGAHPVASMEGEVQLPFIALEYVEGQTLNKVIHAHGGFGLPVARVRRVMRQVARALHSVHEQRIVHRDLKPSNILLTQLQGQEVAKVTDFGLVKLPQLAAFRTATVAGASMGYAPPEQYEMGNNRVTVQTDVFSFAAILYESLCGTEAFPYKMGDNPLRIVARMLSGERPALVRVSATVPRELRDRPDLTAALDREISRATNPDPTLRHPSIREFWESVEPLLRDATSRAAASTDDPASFDGAGLAMSAGPSSPPSSSLRSEWRMIGRPMTGERLRASVFAPDGRTIVAVGTHGLYRFTRGVWSAMALPSGVDPRLVRGVSRLPTGELVLFGEGGFAMQLSPNGAVDPIIIRDRDLTLLHAHADGQGILFAAERLSRPVGAIVEVPAGSASVVHTIDGTVRLHDVCRTGTGAVLACGTYGALVELTQQGHVDVPWGRTGHLYAIAGSLDGGAYAVGSGGHALRISASGYPAARSATLEAVQTTRDIYRVVVDVAGCAWAVGGQARLLQRREGTWTRLPLDPLVQSSLVDVAPREGGITLLGEDGLVLEGRGIGL